MCGGVWRAVSGEWKCVVVANVGWWMGGGVVVDGWWMGGWVGGWEQAGTSCREHNRRGCTERTSRHGEHHQLHIAVGAVHLASVVVAHSRKRQGKARKAACPSTYRGIQDGNLKSRPFLLRQWLRCTDIDSEYTSN
jgi:hypothetical protein